MYKDYTTSPERLISEQSNHKVLSEIQTKLSNLEQAQQDIKIKLDIIEDSSKRQLNKLQEEINFLKASLQAEITLHNSLRERLERVERYTGIPK